MGSRLRSATHLFECFCEFKIENGDITKPQLVYKYPDNYKDQGVLNQMPKFCFPCPGVLNSPSVQLFTFVMTDIEGKLRFGICRHPPNASACLCILSFLPCFEAFYSLLNKLAEKKTAQRRPDEIKRGYGQEEVDEILDVLYHLDDAPTAGTCIEIETATYKNTLSFSIPNLDRLPSIPENRNLTQYVARVEPGNMIAIFASMLFERRIIFTSQKIGMLTACVHAANALIYPFYWQHIYIPVLPIGLIDYCSCPMPFLVGVHSSMMDKVRSSPLDEAVILNIDNNVLESPFDDVGAIPHEILSQLRNRLKKQSLTGGDSVARAFLKTQVQIFGGYRDSLKFKEGENITFDREAFIQSRPSNKRNFLEKMLNLQTFEQFICGRLIFLNTGQGFSDEFELEITATQDKAGAKHLLYSQWFSSMKKLQKGGEAVLSTIKNTTNPAVKNVYKQAKDIARTHFKEMNSQFKDVRNKLKSKELEEPPSNLHSSGSENNINTLTISKPIINVRPHGLDDMALPQRIQSLVTPRLVKKSSQNANVSYRPKTSISLREGTRPTAGKSTAFRHYNVMNVNEGDEANVGDRVSSSSEDEHLSARRGEINLRELEEILNKQFDYQDQTPAPASQLTLKELSMFQSVPVAPPRNRQSSTPTLIALSPTEPSAGFATLPPKPSILPRSDHTIGPGHNQTCASPVPAPRKKRQSPDVSDLIDITGQSIVDAVIGQSRPGLVSVSPHSPQPYKPGLVDGIYMPQNPNNTQYRNSLTSVSSSPGLLDQIQSSIAFDLFPQTESEQKRKSNLELLSSLEKPAAASDQHTFRSAIENPFDDLSTPVKSNTKPNDSTHKTESNVKKTWETFE